MPDTAVQTTSTVEPLTEYGQMRKNFLKRNKPLVYKKMLESGELHAHCLKIQQQAQQRLEGMMDFFTTEYSQLINTTDKRAWEDFLTLGKAMTHELILDNLIYRYF